MSRRLACLAAGGFGAIVLFEVALALGAPLGEAAMGGSHSGQLPSDLRVVSALGAAFWSLAALTVLSRGGFAFSPVPRRAARWGTWVLVVVLALGTVMNAASPSSWERFGWAPLVLALTVVCFRLARTEGTMR